MSPTSTTEREMIDRPLALITGGSRGIGAAIARELASTHRLIIGGTSTESLAGIIGEIPGSIPFIAHLDTPEQMRRAVDEVMKDFDSLDVLVHSAGLGDSETVEQASWELWNRVFTLNVFAVAELTRLTLPYLRAADGMVITINSGSGHRSGPGGAVYSGSKFALRAFTDALREEERGTVRVTSIHPGRVDTDMQVQLQHKMGNTNYDGTLYIRPDQVAKTVRLAVDITDESCIEELSIRPVHK